MVAGKRKPTGFQILNNFQRPDVAALPVRDEFGLGKDARKHKDAFGENKSQSVA